MDPDHRGRGKPVQAMQGPQGPRPKIHVVLDWFEELKRLVPTGE